MRIFFLLLSLIIVVLGIESTGTTTPLYPDIPCGSTDCKSNQRCELQKIEKECLENCELGPICVDYSSSCGENEKIYKCGTACEPSCQDPDPLYCTKQCLIDVCQCERGFVRDETSKKCVKVEDCNINNDKIRENLCKEKCEDPSNCYIQSSLENEILTPICTTGLLKMNATYFVESVTPTPQFNSTLDVSDVKHPRMICSIKCAPGKHCEIVDLQCMSEICPEIDVCVDDAIKL